MSETDERERLGDEIASLMGPLVRAMHATFRASADELGLALSEAQALQLLAVRGSLATKELARALGIDPANASTLITKLGRRGLVRRHAATHDRRQRLVTLTDEGRRTRERLGERMAGRQPRFVKLTTEELATFRDPLRRVEDPA
jgi:DNA-binding MarR family transcriptional regulator